MWKPIETAPVGYDGKKFYYILFKGHSKAKSFSHPVYISGWMDSERKPVYFYQYKLEMVGWMPLPDEQFHLDGDRVKELMSDGFWRSCSGCYESNEGYPTAPTDAVLKCERGSGCRECGGIGAIWDSHDYSDIGMMLKE